MSAKSTPTITDEKRAEIEKQVRKRVALEKQAFEYVKHLSLTDSVADEELMNIGQHITKGDYTDVTEERSIEKLCGYPLCSNVLKDVLKQKYKISPKNSTVYDITERKKFCSNQCYVASKHFHQQLSETPVWLRDTEPPVRFTVLHREESDWEQLGTMLNLDLKDYLDDMKSLIYTFELDEKKKFLNNSRINLKQHLITEEDISAIVEYMISISDEMDMVD